MLRPISPDVLEAVAAQNARLPPSPARARHLEALRGGAPVVVTGQQMGLFLGPLFTLYKASTAVRLARAEGAVPVFWLQTEDHDLPEIAECGVPAAAGRVTIRVPASAEERISVAHRVLPTEIEGALEELGRALGGLPHAEAHLLRLSRHYRAGAGWAAAFAGVLAELLAEEGLVFVDPRDPALARAAAPVHRRALVEAERIAAALTEAAVTPTVHVRPGAPLAFFHPRGPAGPRYRLEPAGGDRFAEVGGAGAHDRAALLEALAREPRCFSSSALLRPLVQDTLLPTLAYVGGPAEVGYFAQLPPLYACFDLPPPRVVPRARFRVVDEKAQRLLDRLGLQPADSERPEDELLARARAGGGGWPSPDEVARRLLGAWDAEHAALARAITAAGPQVERALEKTRGSVAHAVEKLAGKYRHALLHRDQELVDAVRRLKELLQPGGLPQERVYGLPWYAARYGERPFLEAVLAATDPQRASLEELRP